MLTSPFKQLVERPHPKYERLAPFWDLALASYRGGREYLDSGNLWSHRLENQPDHSRRMARSYFLNYCAPVVDTYVAFLFREDPVIEPAERLGALLSDADRQGTGLVQFMKRCTAQAAIFGYVMVGVDRPKAENTPMTAADEAAMGLSQYFVAVTPPDFFNWGTDADGALTFCVIRERNDANPIIGESASVSYRFWTSTDWYLLDKEGRVLDSGSNPYGRVPFVPCKFKDTEPGPVGTSLLANIAYVNREIYNLCSLLQEILYRQTFSQLVAEGSAEEYGRNGDLTTLSTSSIFLYPEGRNPPQYISPDATQAQLLADEISRKIDEIYRLACLSRGTAREGQLASGISKAFDFLDTNQALADVASNVARSFESIFRIAMPGWGGKIRFLSDFGVLRADDLVDRTDRILKMPIGPEFRRIMLRRLAHSVVSDLPQSDLQKVFEEIDRASGQKNWN